MNLYLYFRYTRILKHVLCYYYVAVVVVVVTFGGGLPRIISNYDLI